LLGCVPVWRLLDRPAGRFPNLTNRSAGKVAGALEDEAAERGWLVDNPTRRLRATLAAVLLTSRRRSLHRTEGGTELAERGEAFQSALYTHHREVDAEWYPHAVALGRSVEFARTLDARGDPPPQWLVDEQEPPLTWANVSDLALKGSPYGPGAADGAMLEAVVQSSSENDSRHPSMPTSSRPGICLRIPSPIRRTKPTTEPVCRQTTYFGRAIFANR